MADWSLGISKIRPGAKAYLFTGEAGNAVDLLVTRASAGAAHRRSLTLPLTRHDLGAVSTDDTEVLILRGAEHAREADWTLLDQYLAHPRVPGVSLIITATQMPDSDAARAVRQRVKSRGLLVDITDPTGVVGRKALIQWVAEEWQTTVAVATLACTRANYSIEALVWATRIFTALSSGRPMEGMRAQRMAMLAVLQSPAEEAYDLLLARSPQAVDATRNLDARQTRALLHRLEAALTDIEILYPVLGSGLSAKAAASKTGIHIARVLELAEAVPRFPPGVATKSRQMLAVGLRHLTQREAASTVAILWS